jgi:hypothetical protein
MSCGASQCPQVPKYTFAQVVPLKRHTPTDISSLRSLVALWNWASPKVLQKREAFTVPRPQG